MRGGSGGGGGKQALKLTADIKACLHFDFRKLVESDILPHLVEKTWLVYCERKEAEKDLAGRPDGTFLVRGKVEDDQEVYALSTV